MFRQNPRSVRGASHHAAFIGNSPTIILMFLALQILWTSSPSRKSERGVSPRFHLFVFLVGVNQEK